MCGIIGYLGKDRALPKVLNGLKFLEYRGYDSAGVAYVLNNKVSITKEAGRISNLEDNLDLDLNTNVAIGHTRWATHGVPSKVNSHPHRYGKFTVVHNGIIENYQNLKDKLLSIGYKFQSETDTEVIPALLDYNYNSEKNILKCIKKTIDMLKGSFALCILCDDDLDHIYGVKYKSPLIIASDTKGNYFASDVPAILEFTNKYILLAEGDVAILSSDSINVYDNNLNKKDITYKIFDGNSESAKKNGYEHYMLKEIIEEDKVFLNTLNYYTNDLSFKDTMPDLSRYKKIHIVGCGSAYYVGLIGANLIKEYANIPVEVSIASEYRYDYNFDNRDTLVIVISQSGETADSLAALRKANDLDIDTLGIVNVVSSSIAREAKYVLYTKAGIEISVATTKAFLSQLVVLILIVIKLSNNNKLLKELNGADKLIRELLQKDYKKYAKKIYKHDNVFFIGRLIDYGLCLEGSLKLKEVSYINSIAYQAGELKHGTISLINNQSLVIAIANSESVRNKTISNIKEVIARGAKTLLITNSNEYNDLCDDCLIVPKTSNLVMPLVTIIPLQLMAYEVAKLRGCDIDKPKNLAKSVTVE